MLLCPEEDSLIEMDVVGLRDFARDYCDITWVSWHIRFLMTQQFVQQLIQANNKETMNNMGNLTNTNDNDDDDDENIMNNWFVFCICPFISGET